MRAAELGLFGAAIKAIFDLIPDYEKTNYQILPIGTREEDGKTKAVYLRLPEDETGRLLGGLLWKLLHQDATWQEAAELPDFLASQMPSLSPAIDAAAKWTQFARGQNPRDDFRRRDIVDPTHWDAGGWSAASQMLKWQTDQFGILSILAHPITTPLLGENAGEGHEGTLELVVGAIPGINRMIRVSDRGISEKQWADVDLEDQEKARFKLSLPEEARRLVKERYRLNRLGEGRIPSRDAERRGELNVFYNKTYLPMTRSIHAEEEAGNKKGADALRSELRTEAARLLK